MTIGRRDLADTKVVEPRVVAGPVLDHHGGVSHGPPVAGGRFVFVGIGVGVAQETLDRHARAGHRPGERGPLADGGHDTDRRRRNAGSGGRRCSDGGQGEHGER
jgi:hypothetical protein